MANATTSISTAAEAMLFGLAQLFIQQPNAAAVGYTLYAVFEAAPHFLPTYDTTAEKVKSFASNLRAQQHSSTARDVFVDKTTTVTVDETPRVPHIETTSAQTDTPNTSTGESNSLYAGTFVMLEESSTTPSAIIDVTTTDEATSLIDETQKSPEVETTSGDIEPSASSDIKGTSLTFDTSEQSSPTPEVFGGNEITVDQETSNTSEAKAMDGKPDTSCLNELENGHNGEDYNMANDECVDGSNTSTSLAATQSSTGPSIIPPTCTAAPPAPSEKRSMDIASPPFSEVVDILKATIRPFTLFVLIPLLLFGINNTLFQKHRNHQRWFCFAVGTFYAFVIAYLACESGNSGLLNELWQLTRPVIALFRCLLAIIPTCIRKSVGLESTFIYHWGRIQRRTIVALLLQGLHVGYVIMANIKGYAMTAPRHMLFVVQVILIIGNLWFMGTATYAQDLVIPFMAQVSLQVWFWSYQNKDDARQCMFYVATQMLRALVLFVSGVQMICNFIGKARGWLYLYTVIVYDICAPEELHWRRLGHAILSLRSHMAQHLDWPQVKVMVQDLDLYNRFSLVQDTFTNVLSGWYQMRHDAEAWVIFIGQYLFWVYSSPRDSWATIKFYFSEVVTAIPGSYIFVQALCSAWVSVKTFLICLVHQAPVLLDMIVRFTAGVWEAVVQPMATLFEYGSATWTQTWNTSWCPLCMRFIWDIPIVFGNAFVFTIIFMHVVCSDALSSYVTRRHAVCIYTVAYLAILLLTKDCLQEIFAAIFGALSAFLAFCVYWPFLTTARDKSDPGGEAEKVGKIGGYVDSDGSDGGSDILEDIVDSPKGPSAAKEDITAIAGRVHEKENEKHKLATELGSTRTEQLMEGKKLTPKPTRTSAPRPAPRSTPRHAPRPSPLITHLPSLEDVLNSRMSSKQAQLDQTEQEGRAKHDQQIGHFLAQSGKINQIAKNTIEIEKLGGIDTIAGDNLPGVHTEGVQANVSTEHPPPSTNLSYTLGFQVPDDLHESHHEPGKEDDESDKESDVTMSVKKTKSKSGDKTSVVPEPPSSITASEPEVQTIRASSIPTTFARRTSLNLDNFALPSLYNRPANRPTTGVDSKEEWRNRILGSPSILTEMRQEREAAAAYNRSNGPSSGGVGSSCASHPGPPAGEAGPGEDDGRIGGDDGAPPKPPADKQDEDSKPSTDNKNGKNDDASKTNGGGAPIAAAMIKVDNGDIAMDDAPEVNDTESAANTNKPITDSSEEDVMEIVNEDVPPELLATSASGDIDMDDTSSHAAAVKASIAQRQQGPMVQNPPPIDLELVKVMNGLAAVAAPQKRQAAQITQATQNAQATQDTQASRTMQAPGAPQPTVPQSSQRNVLQPTSSQIPQQQTLPADQTISLLGIPTALVPPAQIAALPITPATQLQNSFPQSSTPKQPPPPDSFLQLNTPTLPKTPTQPVAPLDPVASITQVAPVAPIVPIPPVGAFPNSQKTAKPAPIFTNFKLPETTATPPATARPWSGNFGTANPFSFSTAKASSAQPLAASQPIATSQSTKVNVTSSSISQSPRDETKSAPEVSTKTDPVIEDGSGAQFSDISSLDGQELNDTSEGERMLARAVSARTSNGPKNAAAAPPVAPQSPVD